MQSPPQEHDTSTIVPTDFIMHQKLLRVPLLASHKKIKQQWSLHSR